MLKYYLGQLFVITLATMATLVILTNQLLVNLFSFSCSVDVFIAVIVVREPSSLVLLFNVAHQCAGVIH